MPNVIPNANIFTFPPPYSEYFLRKKKAYEIKSQMLTLRNKFFSFLGCPIHYHYYHVFH